MKTNPLTTARAENAFREFKNRRDVRSRWLMSIWPLKLALFPNRALETKMHEAFRRGFEAGAETTARK